jgi:Fe-S oxidoreductase
MLKGDPLTGGWREEAVKESLDLCLSCKGCTSDCPVHVDIPTYKAEFLSHYYARRRRPARHYLLGLMPWWGRAAARAPRLANALSHAPVLARAGKRATGIAVERDAPRFASDTFVDWFARRPPPPARQRTRVVLWPDTFTNFFHPEVGQAAVQVLEDAAFAIELPARPVCCGRPLYDFGMLGLAKRVLRRDIDALAEPIEHGVPVLVLEPSCAAVFRDELRKLMPNDRHAGRLAEQTLTLDELLARHAPDWEPPTLERQAIMHGHCHHAAIGDLAGEEALLRRAGLDVQRLNAGCCGMAGSFGYEAGDPYRVSMRAGERVLLPAVRAAPDDALIVADGFSCRTQIHDATGRRALHTAEVLLRALQGGEPVV